MHCILYFTFMALFWFFCCFFFPHKTKSFYKLRRQVQSDLKSLTCNLSLYKWTDNFIMSTWGLSWICKVGAISFCPVPTTQLLCLSCWVLPAPLPGSIYSKGWRAGFERPAAPLTHASRHSSNVFSVKLSWVVSHSLVGPKCFPCLTPSRHPTRRVPWHWRS
jgi:hypothetical protein